MIAALSQESARSGCGARVQREVEHQAAVVHADDAACHARLRPFQPSQCPALESVEIAGDRRHDRVVRAVGGPNFDLAREALRIEVAARPAERGAAGGTAARHRIAGQFFLARSQLGREHAVVLRDGADRAGVKRVALGRLPVDQADADAGTVEAALRKVGCGDRFVAEDAAHFRAVGFETRRLAD